LVYSHIEIVIGVKLTRQQAHKVFDIEEDDDDVVDYHFGTANDGKEQIRLFEQNCCNQGNSDPRNCIVGISVHTYYRKLTGCDDYHY